MGEDLDDKPTKYHELHNQLHVIMGQNGVVLQRLQTFEKQNDTIAGGISGLSDRLHRFEARIGDMEKAALTDRGRFDHQLLQVKSDLELKILSLTSSLNQAVERLNPVRMVVFGMVGLILSGVLTFWVTRQMIGDSEDRQDNNRRPSYSAPGVP